MTLDAGERERIRREIDRRTREQLDERLSVEDACLTIPEASGVLGIKAPRLRQMIRDLGIETRRQGRATVIAVSDLDRLRGRGEIAARSWARQG